jgi:hypothetical protein
VAVPVLVRDRDNGAFLIRAAEQINKDTLTDMARLSRSAPYLLISTNRAMAIGLHPRDDAAACSIALSDEQDSDVVRGLIGDIPLNADINHLSILAEKPSSVAETILMLMRVARLLPGGDMYAFSPALIMRRYGYGRMNMVF